MPDASSNLVVGNFTKVASELRLVLLQGLTELEKVLVVADFPFLKKLLLLLSALQRPFSLFCF